MLQAERESDYLRALFDQLPVGVLIKDDSGKYVDANPAACELLHRSREEILGKAVYDFVEESRREEVRLQWTAFLRDGSQSGVFELSLPDGGTIKVQFIARANFLPGLHCSFLTAVTATATESEAGSEEGDLITMCAWTKRVKRGHGWVSLEEYLAKTHGVRVSHGISPDALARFRD